MVSSESIVFFTTSTYDTNTTHVDVLWVAQRRISRGSGQLIDIDRRLSRAIRMRHAPSKIANPHPFAFSAFVLLYNRDHAAELMS